MNLTDEQLNTALCEWMGWTDCHKSLASNKEIEPHERCFIGIPPGGIIHRRLPNYLSVDSPRRLLNEAEARLTNEQKVQFAVELARIATSHLPASRAAWMDFNIATASARQRTITILKTVKPEMFQ